MIAFISGTIVGACVGMLVMALLVAARRADDGDARFRAAYGAANDDAPASERKGAA